MNITDSAMIYKHVFQGLHQGFLAIPRRFTPTTRCAADPGSTRAWTPNRCCAATGANTSTASRNSYCSKLRFPSVSVSTDGVLKKHEYSCIVKYILLNPDLQIKESTNKGIIQIHILYTYTNI